MEKKRYQNLSLPQRRNMCEILQKAKELTQSMYPLLYQALHPKNSIFVLISNTQTPGTMNAKYKDTEKMHQISSANCASTKDRKYFQKQP